MHDRWEITWIMRGAKGSLVGHSVVIKGYSLGESKEIIAKYQAKKSEEAGVSLKMKPYSTWLLEFALDKFYNEFQHQKELEYLLCGIEIKEQKFTRGI